MIAGDIAAYSRGQRMTFDTLTVNGRVFRKTIKRGTVNAILTEDGREFILRRPGENALKDPVLDALEGKTLVVNGTVDSHVLLISRYEEVEPTPDPNKV